MRVQARDQYMILGYLREKRSFCIVLYHYVGCVRALRNPQHSIVIAEDAQPYFDMSFFIIDMAPLL